jgi:hypothetical protein
MQFHGICLHSYQPLPLPFSVYSENLHVFKDASNIAEINIKYAKCFAEKMKKMRQESFEFTWQTIQTKG